jgi:two-component system, NtrC family, sensor kinase
LFDIVELCMKNIKPLTTKEERKYIRQMTATLADCGMEDADELAESLVYIGLYESVPKYLPLLKDPEIQGYLKFIETFVMFSKDTGNVLTAAEKMKKIVFALKSYSHLESQGEAVDVDLTGEIDTVLTLYYNQLKKGIEVIRDFESNYVIAGYPDELAQVFTNIIHNAIQAMKGEGRLVVGVRQVGDGCVAVSFTDNGPGVPKEILPKIFNPFFTTKAKGEGSGLGLDICKKIIDKHKGRIEVASVPGETIFTVFLPRKTTDE